MTYKFGRPDQEYNLRHRMFCSLQIVKILEQAHFCDKVRIYKFLIPFFEFQKNRKWLFPKKFQNERSQKFSIIEFANFQIRNSYLQISISNFQILN